MTRPALPESYWAATAAPAPSTPALEGETQASVCIVGGGFLGLSAALHLAEAGTDVVLLEAAEPGWGASGRNGGQIIPGMKLERADLIAKLGPEAGERLFAWGGDFADFALGLIERHGIDCLASQPGWIQAAHSSEAFDVMERRARDWQAQGADVTLLDAAETERLLGSGWYRGAYLDRRGGRLNPLGYARGLARAAIAAGARIHGDTLVQELVRDGSGWRIVSARGSVLAEQVLLCTNAYTDLAGREALVPGLARSVVPLPSYMVATRPLSDNLRRSILPDQHTVADNKRLLNHFRLEPDGRFLFGGRGGLTEGPEPAKYRHVVVKLRELFPQLGDQDFDYFWSGKVAMTTDTMPHLHRLGHGLTAALGCNGRGVGTASKIGKLVADLLLGLPSADSPIPVSAVRPIPFHRLRLPAMQAAVWWKGRQDRQARSAG